MWLKTLFGVTALPRTLFADPFCEVILLYKPKIKRIHGGFGRCSIVDYLNMRGPDIPLPGLISCLVGGIPTPLKIWLRQLGWWHSQYMESHQIQVPNHQPDVDDNSVLMVIRKVSSISELANPTKPTQFRHANRHGPCQFLGVWSLVSSNKRGIANWGSKNWLPYPYPYHLTIGCLCWGSVYVS